jgi:beta-lactamase regulating signal transducer with metallopeptidase domain
MRTIAQFLLTLLLNAFWQIILVTMFAALCAWILRGTAAWQRHAVWVAALVLSLCLPIVSSISIVENARPLESKPREIPATDSVKVPFEKERLTLTENESTDTIALAVDQDQTVPASKSSSTRIGVNEKLAGGLIALYLLFGLYRATKLFRAWRRTIAIVRSAYSLPIPDHFQSILNDCQKTLGVTRFRLLFSAAVPVPITAGVFTPLIILPEEILHERDRDTLCSALGHELVHVARRDYALNLLYEIIYLPLAFHPAASFLRRRVRQTRELCCDELVASKLVRPEVYARSLVRLIGSGPIAGRLAADTTIGITDADILEVRIMSLLKRSQISPRRRALLLIAASLLLGAPCVAATSFALNFDLTDRAQAVSQQDAAHQERQRAREDLKRKAEEIKAQAQKHPQPHGAEAEALRRLEIEMHEAAVKLSEADRDHQQKEVDKLRATQKRLEELAEKYFIDGARVHEAQELAELQRQLPQNMAAQRDARARLQELVTKYPQMKGLEEAREALRLYEQQIQEKEREISTFQEKVDEKLKQKELKEEKGERKREAAEEQEERYRGGVTEMRRRKQLDEGSREERNRRHAELTKGASISMDRAIQVATSQYPGKVLACSLGRDADGRVFYHVVIIAGEAEKNAARYVWVSALDGQIMKTEKE